MGGWTPTDMVARMFKSWIELGHAHAFDVALTPADEVARFIVARALVEDGPGRTWHVDAPHRHSMTEIAARLAELGHPVRVVPYEDYRSILAANLADPSIAGLFEILPERWDSTPYDRVRRVSCSRTQDAMRSSGATLPPLDRGLLERYVRTFQRAGFIRAADR